MKKILLVLVATLLVLGVVYGDSRAGVHEWNNQVYFRLHFGMGVGSTSVSPDILRDFLEKEVVPRFPSGMAVETAVLGQWMSDKGLIREKNILVNISADDSPESYKKIKEVGELYTKRFANAKASLFVVPIPVPKTLHYY